MAKYSGLEEIRRKKALLKIEVKELEKVLVFDNSKESLSAITNGFTDKYLSMETNEEGKKKLSINKKEIVRDISTNVKDKMVSKSTIHSIANTALESGLLENAIKLGAVTFIGNAAQKSLKNPNWKKKILGLVLIYVAPFVLRFLREKLDDYQKSKSLSSMEKLI